MNRPISTRMTAARHDAGPVGDDDALMRRIAARDALVFADIVAAHAGALHRIAYRMIADAVEAEDMTQEALLRLWKHAPAWQPGRAGIAAWLTRVTVNLCLDRLRRHRFTSDVDAPDHADATPGADATIDAERARARTVAAIGGLSDRHRVAIVLTYYEDMPNAAAAEALDMNVKAFESLLLRARAALRSQFAVHGIIDVSEGFAA